MTVNGDILSRPIVGRVQFQVNLDAAEQAAANKADES